MQTPPKISEENAKLIADAASKRYSERLTNYLNIQLKAEKTKGNIVQRTITATLIESVFASGAVPRPEGAGAKIAAKVSDKYQDPTALLKTSEEVADAFIKQASNYLSYIPDEGRKKSIETELVAIVKEVHTGLQKDFKHLLPREMAMTAVAPKEKKDKETNPPNGMNGSLVPTKTPVMPPKKKRTDAMTMSAK